MNHKAGFVSILGKPNIGKSTLLNALLNEKLSIVTPKAQTTRHRIFGILNSDDYQIVFSDTPGFLKPAYKMQESMKKAIEDTFTDSDVFIFVVDSSIESFDNEMYQKVKQTKSPTIIVINKIDLSEQQIIAERINYYNNFDKEAIVIPVSALHKANIQSVIEAILQFLPTHEPYFPKDELSDKPVRFFVSEIIREKIFLKYEQEIPYSTEVVIDSFKEEDNIIRIHATIHVNRDSQKGILIGEKGSALKYIGTKARIDIENFLQKKVFLQLYVKVSKDWRNNENMLKNFGYDH